MQNFTLTQAQAIAQMAQGTHEYNRGVLAMLGQEQLATDYTSSVRWIETLVTQRDALDTSPADDVQSWGEPLNPAAQAVQDKIDAEKRVRHERWARIQALIDAAKDVIERNDPMGMRYW